MTKTEYYQKIESSLLNAMKAIDESVNLMNYRYHENYKSIDEVLVTKKIIKKVLNENFDALAIKRKLKKQNLCQ
jgi:hypothetical protein